jgi:hypothetical protein
MAGSFTKYPTAIDVIQAVQGQLGLPVSAAAATNPTDETAQQMLRLLTWSGRRLLKPTSTFRWSTLLKTWALTTNTVDTLYDLPADWDSFEDLTGWNFTSRLPMLGPATDPQWQCLKARNLGSSTISVIYRVRGGQFEIYNTFSSAQNLRIDYSSRSWVRIAGTTPATYRDYVLADDDTLMLDNELLTAKLKLAFLSAKGFDTTGAQSDYNEIEEAAICADQDAPVLQLARSDTYPLISTQFNVPDTGYGS